MGRHNDAIQAAIQRGRAPAWTKQRLGWKLLALSLVIACVAIWVGAGVHTYWFRATPEPRRTPITAPPAESTEPGVSLTVGPEQSPSATPTAPVTRPPAEPEPGAEPAEPTPSPAPPPRADRKIPKRALTCAVAVTRTAVWEDAFTGRVAVTNRDKTAVNGWTVGWRFRDGARMRQVWNARFSQDGPMVTVRDDGWNGTIAPGETVSVGFEASLFGRGDAPDRFTLNGVPCADAGRSAER